MPMSALPVRLVLPMRIVVVRGVGERQELRRRRHEPRRQRQLGAQAVHFVEIVLERDAPPARGSRTRACRRTTNGLPSRSPPIHEPGRRNGGSARTLGAERPRCRSHVSSAAYSLRHLGRGTCSGSRRGRCRSRPSPAACDSRSIAVCHSASTCRCRPIVEFARFLGRQLRRGRATAAAARSRARSRGCSCAAPRSDARSAPGSPARRRTSARSCRALDARRARVRSSAVGDAAALRRRAGERVRAPAAVLMDVLGDVREMREIAERAHDVERLRDRQVVEQRRELGLAPRAPLRGSARRKRIAVWRIASMRAIASSPVCARSTSPSTRPSRRVSSLQRQILVDRRSRRASRRPCRRVCARQLSRALAAAARASVPHRGRVEPALVVARDH